MSHMEKTMSVEEKIRRAEEIYHRRNGNSYVYRSTPKEKKGPSLMSRMIKQIIVCFIIYGVFYVVTNREYFLSTEFQTKVQNLAAQNETLNNAYQYIMGYLQKYFPSYSEEETSTPEESQDENAPNQSQTNETSSEENLDTNDENIGGSTEDIPEEEKTQEQKDVEEIKNTTSFMIPIQGTISSTFGWRTPTTKTVPKYHTGLDIAAETGTIIKAATDGTVILASSEGDYGNHYKIQIEDIVIIYAHCSKLYLKEGDTVYQGQEIAEVGSTGNSTGPHLHFEIRKEERLVDPQLILDI